MIATRKDKITALVIVVLFIGSWLVLAWLTKTGAFETMADVIQNPDLITK